MEEKLIQRPDGLYMDSCRSLLIKYNNKSWYCGLTGRPYFTGMLHNEGWDWYEDLDTLKYNHRVLDVGLITW